MNRTLVFYLEVVNQLVTIKINKKYTSFHGVKGVVRIKNEEVVGTLMFFDSEYIGEL